MKIILGISAYYHDSSAALIIEGKIVAAVEEERFTRIKHTEKFPANAIQYCLQVAQISLQDVDAIVFYEKPILKFERILETAYRHAPKGLALLYKALPLWINSKLNLRKTIQKELYELFKGVDFPKNKILFSDHHVSHAASTYFTSPFKKAAILTIDGVGEWATLSISKGEENKMTQLVQQNFPHSLGLLYSCFTYFLGFKVNDGEYKLMGLSPYGNLDDKETQLFISQIEGDLIQINEDGSFELNLTYFKFTSKNKLISITKWEELFDTKSRKNNADLTQSHANLALAIQVVTEKIVLKLCKHAKEITGSNNLAFAGGVALNCVANGKLVEAEIFDDIWIQPAASDAGGSIGAALACYYANHPQAERQKKHARYDSLFGPLVSNEAVEVELAKHNYRFKNYTIKKDFLDEVSNLIIDQKIVGWIQGRMEFGPRALGARSIIASPFSKDIQLRINRDVKFREDFRPFAPVMLKEEAKKYYTFEHQAAFMQFVAKIKSDYRYPIPSDFSNRSILEKASIATAKLEAVTHVDFSSRLQIIENEDHPLFDLLNEMKRKTNAAVLLNTSFNLGGEPIVMSAKDAFHAFTNSGLDVLVINNYIIYKN